MIDGAADAPAIQPGPTNGAGPDAGMAAPGDAPIAAVADAAAALADAQVTMVDLVPPDLAADAAGAPDRAAPAPSPSPALTPVQGNNDLSGPGLADWVHFGRGGAGAVNRKVGVAAPRIRMALAGGGELAHFADSSVRLTWTNGTPTAAGSEVDDGVANGGEPGRGFRLEVVGDPRRPSRLKLFIGLWNAQAQLVARVGDDPPLPTLVEDVTTGSAERVYTVSFGPVPSLRPLVVTWTLNALHHVYGNVTLRAATLEDL